MKQAGKVMVHPSVGDHIYVVRSLGYAHHGIFMDDSKVVHFQTPLETGEMDSSEIVESDLYDFIGPNHSEWYVYKYGATDEEFSSKPRGTCTTKQSDDPETVLKRAREALREGFGQFNIVGSNCEDFALYCKTGQRCQVSGQYLSAMRKIEAARQAAATGYKSPIVYAGCVLGWLSAKDFQSHTNANGDIASSTDKKNGQEAPLDTAL